MLTKLQSPTYIFALISQILNIFLRYNNWQSLTIVDKCKIWWLTLELIISIFARFKKLFIINNKIINLKKLNAHSILFFEMPTNSKGKNMTSIMPSNHTKNM